MEQFKKFMIAFLFVCGTMPVFATDWFVCLGSFKERSNAEQFRKELSLHSVPAFIFSTERNGLTLHRVLLSEPFADEAEALRLKDGIESTLKKHVAINGALWVCAASLPPETGREQRTIRVTDSDTGEPLAMARLTVDETFRTDTDSNGEAELPDGLQDGAHSLLIESDGHVDTRTQFSTADGAVETPPVYSVARVVDGDGGSIKAVLNWGQIPSDLDLHVFSGERHVYYNYMYYDESDIIELDIDDTSYEGPETITVRNRRDDAVYKFYVHDFSNASDLSNEILSQSGARVQLTIDNADAGTYEVPADKTGVWWHVFDVEKDGSVTVHNTVSNENGIE